MSHQNIQATLELKLSQMAPSLPTAYENKSFTPVQGQPYQEVTFLPNDPRDLVMGRKLTELVGFFYVALMYPANAGRGAAQARADLVRQHFKPLQTLVHASGLQVHLHDTAIVRAGTIDGDRWRVTVIVPWRAYI